MSTPLRERYAAVRAEAEHLAGGLLDIPRRAVVLQHIYLDSGGNHAFSLIAAHGALWAHTYFEVGGSVGRFIGRRYFYNPRERTYRLGLLNGFAERFREVNRRVCVDTFANYEFTKRHGREPGAEEVVPPPLLDALNRVHSARERGTSLAAGDRRKVFEQSFRCEQEVTVAPGVAEAVDTFDCRILKFILLHPLVRFAYFPRRAYLVFRNFASTDERIAKGLRAYDLAERAGWEHVRRSTAAYAVMPGEYLTDPHGMFARLSAWVEPDQHKRRRVATDERR